jgi:uncharacterized protein (TIGR02646 family)
MRRLLRPPLESALEEYLEQMQSLIDSGADVAAAWKTQQQRVRMRRIVRILASITGPRERCMFCEDSRGTDVEHFRPKSLYPQHTFRWRNFLWICTGCNRSKGNRFPCDPSGLPLLVDPTVERPWDFLFFDSDTGMITARWEAETGVENPKGKAVIETLSTLQHQAVTEGRRRTSARLRRCIGTFLSQQRADSEEISSESLRDLLESIDDATDYGIAVWFFSKDGRDEEPFRTLRDRFPSIWDKIVIHLNEQ